MAFKTLELQDCFNVIKAFERGCAYSATEESVYAVLTPLISGIQTQTSSILAQFENEDNIALSNNMLSSALGGTDQPASLSNMDKSDDDDESIVTRLVGNFLPDAVGKPGEAEDGRSGIFGNAFNSECIPCGERLNMLGELGLAKFLDQQNNIAKAYGDWLRNQLDQLQSIIDMITNPNKYVDLCALLKFLNDFICIPDLQRILASLMALMSRVSFQISLSFDLIMGLVGLLVAPILTSIMNMLQSFILLIISPLNCIIDSLQGVVSKLDYNVLFSEINRLDKHISIGSNEPVSSAGVDMKIPLLGTVKVIDDFTLPSTGTLEADFNQLGPVGERIKQKNVQTQYAVNFQAEKLKAVQSRQFKVDASDPEAVKKWKAELSEAHQEYVRAIENNDQSAIGRIVKQSEQLQQGLNSSVYSLISMLNEAKNGVIEFFYNLFGEVKRIMDAYTGGGQEIILTQMHKLELIQMMAFVAALIKSMANQTDVCSSGDEITAISLVKNSNLDIFTDEEGAVHIIQNPDKHRDMVNSIVEAVAAKRSRSGNVNNAANADAVMMDTGKGGSMQKLKSLIEFTGDPIIDTQLYTSMKTLVTPRSAVFKCPAIASDEKTEQINTWIDELARE